MTKEKMVGNLKEGMQLLKDNETIRDYSVDASNLLMGPDGFIHGTIDIHYVPAVALKAITLTFGLKEE